MSTTYKALRESRRHSKTYRLAIMAAINYEQHLQKSQEPYTLRLISKHKQSADTFVDRLRDVLRDTHPDVCIGTKRLEDEDCNFTYTDITISNGNK